MTVVDISIELAAIGKSAKQAARMLASLASPVKDQALRNMADHLEKEVATILAANAQDMTAEKEKGLSQALLDLLLLNEARIKDMADGLRQAAALPDPIGEVPGMWKRPNGLA